MFAGDLRTHLTILLWYGVSVLLILLLWSCSILIAVSHFENILDLLVVPLLVLSKYKTCVLEVVQSVLQDA